MLCFLNKLKYKPLKNKNPAKNIKPEINKNVDYKSFWLKFNHITKNIDR